MAKCITGRELRLLYADSTVLSFSSEKFTVNVNQLVMSAIIGDHISFRCLVCKLLIIAQTFSVVPVFAQCPVNLDFERGDFTGWKCWAGTVNGGGLTHTYRWQYSGGPLSGSHKIMNSGDGKDEYGLFPRNCPNGGNYSVRLGNDGAGGSAEGVSYTFKVPAGQHNYKIIYYYAVVFQDADHLSEQQPRFEVTVKNADDNKFLPCPIPPFKATSGLAGFLQTPLQPAGQAQNVITYYKDWTAATINLDGYAGKTIELFFKVSDCVLVNHFGYAYVDVDTDCTNAPAGAVFCSKDTSVHLTAPPLFEKYRWFTSSNITLGTSQTLELKPLPNPGDLVFVELTPFYGYGCTDTLKAFLWDTLTVVANAGSDKFFCDNKAAVLGGHPAENLTYNWTPHAGLNNPFLANPSALPAADNVQYTLTVTSAGGGCKATDVVNVVKNCPVIKIYVPSAFTPDKNGVNDRLRPVLFGFSKLNYFRVYHRNGQ